MGIRFVFGQEILSDHAAHTVCLDEQGLVSRTLLEKGSDVFLLAVGRPTRRSRSRRVSKSFQVDKSNMEAVKSVVQGGLKECVLVLGEPMDHRKGCKLLLGGVDHSCQISERLITILGLHVTILALNEFPRDFEGANHNFTSEPFFKLVELVLIVLQVECFEISYVTLFGLNFFGRVVFDILEFRGLFLKLLLAHSHLFLNLFILIIIVSAIVIN